MPALRTVSSETALPIWAKAYNIGKDTQVPLIGVSLLTGLAVHYKTQNAFFLLGPLLMASIIPYTLLVIMPVNRTLLNILDSNEKGKGKETNLRELYIKWDLLHFARTVLSISAFGLTLYGLCSPNTLLLTK
ncbi:hypothetical protein FBU30_006622 [Linnemannia zychae]|nr:hypothetical protein FBU30_006622 [Linnemannia zychae]